MKGNEKVIEQLNSLLAGELSAISQYMIHSEMCSNWGFKRLHDSVEKRAMDEMKHAEKLIRRILFLGGTPTINRSLKINVGKDIESQLSNDGQEEADAIQVYNLSIQLAEDERDFGTADLLRTILMDEEKHLDWLETQLDLIKHINKDNYLAQQME